MSFRVVLTARAERDRDMAFAWYSANYSPDFAARWYNGIQRAASDLSENPHRCGIVRENDSFPFEVRELL